MTFRILTVCTGNICRSPAAERLLADALGASVHVESSGTHATVGQAIDPPMAALLRADGIDPLGFAARQVTEQQIADADVVLALALEHRSHIVDLVPAAVRRTFTLLEFARLVVAAELPSTTGSATQDRLAQLVRYAASARRGAADDDVPDPYGQSAASFEHSYALIRDAVRGIARSVGSGAEKL